MSEALGVGSQGAAALGALGASGSAEEEGAGVESSMAQEREVRR